MPTQRFGEWLRHTREARGLTVEIIAAQTKIPPRHLEALERGDGLALPAFYQRAEVRAVARAVGVDEQLALARLEAELEPVLPLPAEPDLVAPPRIVRFGPTRVRAEYVFAMIGIAVLIVGMAGWGALERSAAGTIAGTTAAGTTAGTPGGEGTAGGQGTAAGEGTAADAGTAQAVVTAQLAAPLSSEIPETPVATAGTFGDVPMAPVSSNELVIQTEPEGARVTVNGIGWGQSPVTIRHIEPGEKFVRVTMDGYAATQRSITIDQGSRETIRILLSSAGPEH